MSNLIPFSFESKSIRVLTVNNEPWFVAKDVLSALEYAADYNPARAVDHVPVEWKGVHPIHTLGGTQDMWCLSEQGFYFFVARSDKPKALPFQKWVAGEVLPSIRKTGYYSAQAEQFNDPAVIALQLADSIKNKIDSLNLLLEHVSDLHVMLSGQRPVEIQQKPVKNQPVDYSIAKTKILEAICDARGQGITERQLQQSCWTFRNTPKLKRQELLDSLIEDEEIVGIRLANKRTPTYFGRQYVKSA